MTAELAAESARITKDLGRIMQQTSIVSEAPLRMTIRDIDAGGAPELSPALLKFIGSVCSCGRPAQCAPGCRAERFDEHLSACEPACPTMTGRFRKSDHKSKPDRLKRAMRSVRRLNPKAYDLLYLVLALGWSFESACSKVNATKVSRGEQEHSPADFAILWVSGASMLTSAF